VKPVRKIVKKLIPRQLFARVEPYGHLAETALMNVRYGFPGRGMKVIGVTGTDGKTTTSTWIYTMLNDAGIKTGLMTTIGYGTPDNWKPNYVHMTSVPAAMLMRRLRDLRARGVEWVVLETTSHALAQHRIWGVPYSMAVMTNVTHEHLDYHKTFDRYRRAKLRLFQLVGRNVAGTRTGIINADDPSADQFAAEVPVAIRYGLKAGDLRATRVNATATGSSFEVDLGGKALKLKTSLPGLFNVYNALAVVAVGRVLLLTPEQIKHGIEALVSVEGRMNRVDEGQNYSLVVDFAHTPDSFEKILADFRGLTDGRLIVVFGSAGRRDEAKRAKQGSSAGKYADLVVVTEEDDRDIDGGLIMDMIAGGAESRGKVRGKDLYLVHDRTEAIQFAVDRAQDGDTVLLLGKGHEKTIEGPDGERPWDEIGVARKAIAKRQKRG
jgi:UDP-N-acetylmuramoyl-L-alanyl-D-glutamate--2,6-diaminopimelate ligase